MKLLYIVLFMLYISDSNARSLHLETDTLPIPDAPENLDEKVILSSADNALEISPLSSVTEGVLIEPVNRSAGAGINTTFYLRDTASWSFFTNAQKRLSIRGDGLIGASAPLLINTELNDGISSLRVNGMGRFDTGLYIKGESDLQSFISFNRQVKRNLVDIDDSVSPYTTTPTDWVGNGNLPVFRMRHPLDVVNHPPGYNTSIARDFMILPYQYGMAIEYNGIVEAWVGEWSVHKGVAYFDVEGQGNGWGGVSWVGNDVDDGGLRATARNNTTLGGNVAYGELSVEKFSSVPNGDLRFRLPAVENHFQFVYGGRGSNNIIAKMKNDGLVIPKVQDAGVINTPEAAQIVFDSTESRFKGYNGNVWVNFGEVSLVTGSFGNGANGADTVYAIPHGLGILPVYYQVTATSRDAGNISYVTADSNFLFVWYSTPPPAGINNLTWNWQVKR